MFYKNQKMILALIFIISLNEIDCNESSMTNKQIEYSERNYPYFVTIEYSNNYYIHACSGTIIHKDWIITTADKICRDLSAFKPIFALCPGDTERKNVEQIRYEIDIFLPHFFILMLKTYETIVFNKFVHAIHIKEEIEIMYNDDGSYKYDMGLLIQREYDISSDLFYITSYLVEISNVSKCENSILNKFGRDKIFIFCAEDLSYRDSHKYYRGNPLVVNNALYGIIPSTVQNQNRTFAVIKVRFFLNFIKHMIELYRKFPWL